MDERVEQTTAGARLRRGVPVGGYDGGPDTEEPAWLDAVADADANADVDADADGSGPGWQAETDDLDLLEPSWQGPRRLNRLTVLLAAGIVAAGGFFGGVLVQKAHDRGLTSSSASLAGLAQRFRAAGGAGGGGLGEFGGGPGAAGATGTGTGTGTGAGTGTSGSGAAAQATPVAVGTVLSITGNTLTIKNFGGRTVVVHVPPGTPVTASGLSGLRPGVSVSVAGTKAADGSVTATSVVSRAGG